MMKYYKETTGAEHEIKSNNTLHCEDTGRVIAVFYNDYDLNDLMEFIERQQKSGGDLR